MLKSFLRERTRKKFFAQTAHPAMRDFLQSTAIDVKKPAAETQYLALDLEMSGMDARTDVILSIGYVPIIDQQIILADACHDLIRIDDVDLSETAPIHNIRNVDLSAGVSLTEALDRLLVALKNRVMVLHHSPLDTAFLNTACQQVYATSLPVPTVDTLAVERRRSEHRNIESSPGAFRLHSCRERYGLPPARAHSAISDAIATAELWLAQLSHISSGKPVKLGYFL